jgi:predicted enzyme related to lactoylglutathione lyase
MTKSKMEIVLDCADPQGLEPFWREALGYASLWSTEELVVLVPQGDAGPPLLLQRVPEGKSGKNRMHIDLVIDDLEAEVTRLVGFGATRAHDGVRELAGASWVTMADPDGNEFCVCSGVEW